MFLTSLLCIILTAINASAYDFEVDGIYYNIISNVDLTVEVTNKYKGSFNSNYSYSGSVVVPDMVRYENKNYSVVRIGAYAFGCLINYTNISGRVGSDITEVILPETIEEIRDCAFRECNKLLKINMPENLNIIGDSAFSGTQLATLVIPDSCTAIGSAAFYNCENLRMIVLGKGLKKINDRAFGSCPKLLEVFFLASKGPICGNSVFYGNGNLRLYVPSRKTYSFGQEMVSFESSSFEYTGLQPRVVWQSNLGKYKVSMPIEYDRLQKDVGTYSSTFTATCAEMNFQFDVPYSYEITKAPLTVSIYDCEKFYGDENPNFQIKSVMGLKNGESLDGISAKCELSTSATKTSNVGKYAITGSFDIKNYEATVNSGTLTIKKAPLKITVNKSEKVYGDENPVFSVSYDGLRNGDLAPIYVNKLQFSTSATKSSGVGNYMVNAAGGEATNYSLTYSPGILCINKAPVKVVTNDSSRDYGDDNPPFACRYSGLKNGETEAVLKTKPTFKTDATRYSNVGTYDVTPQNAEAQNYEFSYAPGVLTIKKVPLTINIVNANRYYGDVNPEFKCLVDGLKNEDILSNVVDLQYSTTATSLSPVGEYPISATYTYKSENYNAKIKGGILTVDKAPVKVSVIDISRIYGEDNPVFDVAYEGLKNGESAPTLTEKFSLTTKADRKTHVGKYDVKIEGGASNNYEFIERKAGQLVILKRGLKVVADDISRKYGHKNPNFTCHYVNFANGDTEKSFSEMPNLNCDANEESVAGQYPIIPSGGESDDYDFEYENGTLTIDKSLVKFKQVDNYAVFNRCAQSVETVAEQPSDLSGLEIKAYRLADDGSGYYWNISMDNVKNVGKYKFELRIDNQTTFGNSEAYLTITKAEPNLVWNQSLKPLKIGEKVYLDFSCDNIDSRPYFDNYDNKVIDVDADVEMDDQGKTVYKWYIRGKSIGITDISMYYPSSNNYFESETINKIIKVEENSSVTEIDSDGIKVYTDNGTIRIENAEQLSMVRVYNANGLIVYDGQDKIVSGLNNGLYLVKIGSKIVKVVL